MLGDGGKKDTIGEKSADPEGYVTNGNASLINEKNEKKKESVVRMKRQIEDLSTGGEEKQVDGEQVGKRVKMEASKQCFAVPVISGCENDASLPKKKKKRRQKRKKKVSVEEAGKEVGSEPDVKRIKMDVESVDHSTLSNMSITQVSGLNESANPMSIASENATAFGKKKKKRKKRKKNKGAGVGEAKQDGVESSIAVLLHANGGELGSAKMKMEKGINEANEQCSAVPDLFIQFENNESLPNKKKKKKRKKRKKKVSVEEAGKEVGGEPDVKRIKMDVESVEHSTPINVSISHQVSSLNAQPSEDGGELGGTSMKVEKSINEASEQCSAVPLMFGGGENNESFPNKKKKKKRRKKKKKASVEKAVNEGNGKHDVNSVKMDIESNDHLTSCCVSKNQVDVPINQVDVSIKKVLGLNECANTMSIASENASAPGKKKKKRRKKKKKGVGMGETKQNGVEGSLSVSLHASEKELPFVDKEQESAGNDNLEQNKSDAQPTKKKRKKRKKKKPKSGNQPTEVIELKNEDEPAKGSEIAQTTKSMNVSNSEVMTSTSVKLNRIYGDQPNKEEITKCWTGGSLLKKDNGFELLGEPFRYSYMPDFLQDSCFLEKLKEELSHIDLIMKNNDLYKFRQTADLKSVSSPQIASLRTFLYGDFRKWLSDVTGIELNDTVAMGSSRYEYTDILLCHDDELEGRRVAYILYLAPPWNEDDGGTLDLFNVDQNGQPKDIVKSLQPKWNTFAFFEVSPVSFHQVHEVLSRDKARISINGWFHGPNIERPPKYVEPPRHLLSPVHIEQDELYSWINHSYLDMETQRSIRKRFQDNSEIELESFLCVDKYEELTDALKSSHLKWIETGPANKQLCKMLKQEKLPDIISSCCKFLQSEALFLILSQLTGLKLHHLAPPDSDPDSDEEEEENKNSCPGMTLDIHKWTHGCYTLIRDGDQERKSCTLETILYLHVADGWTLEHGGSTTYIAKDEDDELLTVTPHSNCLALMYRDPESLRFTKYVNARVQDLGEQNSFFYDFSCTYKE